MNIDRHFFFAPRFNFVWGVGMGYIGICIEQRQYLVAFLACVFTSAVSVWGRRWAEGK